MLTTVGECIQWDRYEPSMINILTDIALPSHDLAWLEGLPGVSIHFPPPGPPGRELPADLLRDQHVVLCKRPPRNFDDLVSLKLLQISTVGYEDMAHLRLADRPLRVCNARGVFDSAIGEWCLAMMINLTRDLRGMMRHQEQGVWERADRFQYEIRGKVVGLYGYGGIGRETARLARAFGMAVHVLSRRPIGPRYDAYTPAGTGDPDGVLPHRVFAEKDEEVFLRDLDYLVLALPHTKQTTGRIGEAQLKALPRRAFLLNPARGPIVQESALLRALHEGWIAGAALDTHFAYPLPATHPLWRLPNVILTPHVAGADRSPLFAERIGTLFRENVRRWLAHEPLLNEVAPAEWGEA